MCIPTMPMLHCTQLPSGFRNHARYSDGSSITAARSPGGDAPLTVETNVAKSAAAMTTLVKLNSLDAIE
jgi:hypothetical protein